jgi:hypothetical protein
MPNDADCIESVRKPSASTPATSYPSSNNTKTDSRLKRLRLCPRTQATNFFHRSSNPLSSALFYPATSCISSSLLLQVYRVLVVLVNWNEENPVISSRLKRGIPVLREKRKCGQWEPAWYVEMNINEMCSLKMRHYLGLPAHYVKGVFLHIWATYCELTGNLFLQYPATCVGNKSISTLNIKMSDNGVRL